MNIEIFRITRDENETLISVSGSLHIEKIIQQFIQEKLPNAETDYHHEAEISDGFKSFIRWLQNKNIEIKKYPSICDKCDWDPMIVQDGKCFCQMYGYSRDKDTIK